LSQAKQHIIKKGQEKEKNGLNNCAIKASYVLAGWQGAAGIGMKSTTFQNLGRKLGDQQPIDLTRLSDRAHIAPPQFVTAQFFQIVLKT